MKLNKVTVYFCGSHSFEPVVIKYHKTKEHGTFIVFYQEDSFTHISAALSSLLAVISLRDFLIRFQVALSLSTCLLEEGFMCFLGSHP